METKIINKNPKYFDFWKLNFPSDGEIEFLKSANQDCFYYYMGMNECRKTILEDKEQREDSFLPCQPVFEAYHQCMTHEKLGSIKDLD